MYVMDDVELLNITQNVLPGMGMRDPTSAQTRLPMADYCHSVVEVRRASRGRSATAECVISVRSLLLRF